ncbi:MAG: hypothetical protein J5691_04740 [Bacilli bacterium]|nr:hypothetical protein [Bacilli bacterium]
MLKKILVGVAICLFIIVMVFIWYFNNQSIKVTTVKESYSMLVSDTNKPKLNVNLYVNQKDSYITDINKISSCFITSYQKQDKYQMNVNSIDIINQTSIKKENYYVYNLSLTFKIDINDDVIINEAYLVLNYNNSKSLDIMIGSISIYKGEVNNDLEISLSCMKAITSKTNNQVAIEAVVLRLNSKCNIEVNNIECLDCNLVTRKMMNCVYDQTNTLADLNNLNSSNSFSFNGSYEIVIKIDYLYKYEINNFPLRISYTVDGINKYMYIDNFTFFINNERSVKISDLTIYEFEYN